MNLAEELITHLVETGGFFIFFICLFPGNSVVKHGRQIFSRLVPFQKVYASKISKWFLRRLFGIIVNLEDPVVFRVELRNLSVFP